MVLRLTTWNVLTTPRSVDVTICKEHQTAGSTWHQLFHSELEEPTASPQTRPDLTLLQSMRLILILLLMDPQLSSLWQITLGSLDKRQWPSWVLTHLDAFMSKPPYSDMSGLQEEQTSSTMITTRWSQMIPDGSMMMTSVQRLEMPTIIFRSEDGPLITEATPKTMALYTGSQRAMLVLIVSGCIYFLKFSERVSMLVNKYGRLLALKYIIQSHLFTGIQITDVVKMFLMDFSALLMVLIWLQNLLTSLIILGSTVKPTTSFLVSMRWHFPVRWACTLTSKTEAMVIQQDAQVMNNEAHSHS